MSNPLATELRSTCAGLRQRPIALSDLIPQLQRAADELDRLERALDDKEDEMNSRLYELAEKTR